MQDSVLVLDIKLVLQVQVDVLYGVLQLHVHQDKLVLDQEFVLQLAKMLAH
jgi:hypothetical protein